MTHHSQGTVDTLDFGPVLERQGKGGVKITFTVHTEVSGQDDKLSMLTLKNQLKDAKTQLADAGLADGEIGALLAPVQELLEDSSYWRLQSRGLIVFAADGFFLPVRVPVELQDSLTIGDAFNLLPVASVLASDRRLYVLALTKNQVRLFDTSRNVIRELPLENVPASFDEVIDELPERVVDVRAGSGGTDRAPSYQGTTGDVSRMLLEKYIRAVGQAIGTRLGTARSQPLVLAAVAEYLPIFAAECPYPAIFDGVVAGNPEHLQPDELRSAAWHLVNESEAAHEAEEQDHARSLAHGGKGAFDLAEIAKAAEEGRVDTLFLPRGAQAAADPDAAALANWALIGTLTNKGTLRTLGEIDGDGLAVLRY